MYKLPYFVEEDSDRVLSFMKENSFAIVSGLGDKYPVATQLPLHIIKNEDGRIELTGHLMRNTDHHKAFEKNPNVLVIFTGPHTYVSASWYANPLSGSTWNYISVHAKGTISFLSGEETWKAVKDITEKYEGTDSPASFHKLPETYVQRLLPAIVGFKIKVESLDNVFKLSQNHDEADVNNIIAELEKRNDHNSSAIATEMRRNKKK